MDNYTEEINEKLNNIKLDNIESNTINYTEEKIIDSNTINTESNTINTESNNIEEINEKLNNIKIDNTEFNTNNTESNNINTEEKIIESNTESNTINTKTNTEANNEKLSKVILENIDEKIYNYRNSVFIFENNINECIENKKIENFNDIKIKIDITDNKFIIYNDDYNNENNIIVKYNLYPVFSIKKINNITFTIDELTQNKNIEKDSIFLLPLNIDNKITDITKNVNNKYYDFMYNVCINYHSLYKKDTIEITSDDILCSLLMEISKCDYIYHYIIYENNNIEKIKEILICTLYNE